MAQADSDALVIFGASGDLAAKMLFPALYAMSARGELDVPVVGVGRSAWTRETFVEHVRESIDRHGSMDRQAFDGFAARLRLVDGDLRERTTFTKLMRALTPSRRPLCYLAIPPGLFATVAQGLANAGAVTGARLAVEKPFGYDLASSRELAAALRAFFDEAQIFRVDHYLAKPSLHELRALRANASLESLYRREHVRCVQITMAETFGVETRGSFFDKVGALRDPFYLRAGKCLPATATEAWTAFRPGRGARELPDPASSFRFRLGPGAVQFGWDAVIADPLTGVSARHIELVADRGTESDSDAYEHLLTDALAGRHLRFERQAGVDAAWRIVNPLLRSPPTVERYSKGTWGPPSAQRVLIDGDRWHDPASMPLAYSTIGKS